MKPRMFAAVPIASRSLQMAAVAFLVAFALGPLPGLAGEVTVFAAASLKNAMDDIGAEWESATGQRLIVSLAGTSALARQIQNGAPADIYIPASQDWMDALQADGLIDAESRFDLLNNSLVLIAHGQDVPQVEIKPGFDLAGILHDGKLAMALLGAVPAGIYGKAALVSLGVWESVADKVAQADNVRGALAFVSTGEAPLGIVYATDARADNTVSVVGVFPTDSYPAIVYPAAALATSGNPAKGQFLEFLRGPQARSAFERQGFGVIAGDRPLN